MYASENFRFYVGAATLIDNISFFIGKPIFSPSNTRQPLDCLQPCKHTDKILPRKKTHRNIKRSANKSHHRIGYACSLRFTAETINI